MNEMTKDVLRTLAIVIVVIGTLTLLHEDPKPVQCAIFPPVAEAPHSRIPAIQERIVRTMKLKHEHRDDPNMVEQCDKFIYLLILDLEQEVTNTRPPLIRPGDPVR
jgi:hypothetical protein